MLHIVSVDELRYAGDCGLRHYTKSGEWTADRSFLGGWFDGWIKLLVGVCSTEGRSIMSRPSVDLINRPFILCRPNASTVAAADCRH